MGYASKVGRAKVSSKNPQALGVCDRCGIWYNHKDLAWQFDWGGASLINKRILVCRPCNDIPQNQLRAIVLPADPTPIINPRTEFITSDEVDQLAESGTNTIDFTTGLPVVNPVYVVTQDGQNVSPQPIGNPNGLEPYALSPLFLGTAYGVQLSIVSMQADGTTIITATTSTAHGLSVNSQISVEGTLKRSATDGFYSVTAVPTATQFKYTVAQNVASGNILGATTLVKTANVGIPYDLTQIPQTGPLT
jgi:hypothetical protein